MSMTVTLTLDDEIGMYLERIAADQGRTASEVASWIVTEDLRREQAIDAEIVTRLDSNVMGGHEPSASAQPHGVYDTRLQRERAGA